MSRIAILAASAVAVIALSGSANAAGFNCNAKLNYAEKTVCDNHWLSREDDRLNSAYANIITEANPGIRHAIRLRELAWLTERNACGANVHCLSQLYRRRIEIFDERF